MYSLAQKSIYLNCLIEKTPFTKWFEINGQTTDQLKSNLRKYD